jgi:peptidase M48-like protein
MPYLGFGSISGSIHLIARIPAFARAVLIGLVLIVACRELGFAEGPALSSIKLNATTLEEGHSMQGVVTLSMPAAYDVEVSLAADPSTAASVPALVKVPAGSTSASFTVSTLSNKKTAFGNDTLVTIYGNYAVTRNASFTSTASLSLDHMINRIVERERETIAVIKRMHPLAETYIQNLRRDKHGRPQPASDHYFLSRLDMSQGPEAALFQKDSGFGLRLMNPFSTALARKFLPSGFAQMALLDADFKKSTYNFSFVRREFLGDLRCIVLDVQPKQDAVKGLFTGRIWVEDRDFNIVRFNGTYTQNSRYNYYLHFDSWRLNLQPGIWLPAYIYSEESDTRRGTAPFHTLDLKAQTRLWGYDVEALNHTGELTQIQIDSVQDASEAAQDFSPIEAERMWERQAEDNALDHLQKVGLLAPSGEVDDVLQAVVHNLITANHLALHPEVRCRVLLTSPLESFTIGRTIVVSRGLLDVLPDEGSLAMILAHELAHVALGHRINTKLAFTDRFFFPDMKTFERLDFQRDPADERAADKKAMELLANSPYRDKLAAAGLFLQALQARAPELTSLIRPHLGNSLGNAATTRMPELIRSAPPLAMQSLDQIAALPLGSRVKLDPWSNHIQLMTPKPVALLSSEDKMPFEVTPFLPYLTRFAASPVQTAEVK